jgi:hypothetical protein
MGQLAWTHTASWFAPELARHSDPELVHLGLVAVIQPDHLDTLNRHYLSSRTHQAVVRALHALLAPDQKPDIGSAPRVGLGDEDAEASWRDTTTSTWPTGSVAAWEHPADINVDHGARLLIAGSVPAGSIRSGAGPVRGVDRPDAG